MTTLEIFKILSSHIKKYIKTISFFFFLIFRNFFRNEENIFSL